VPALAAYRSPSSPCPDGARAFGKSPIGAFARSVIAAASTTSLSAVSDTAVGEAGSRPATA